MYAEKNNFKVIEKRKIKTHKLKEIKEINKVDVVKIDTQGSELDILRGGENLCKKAEVIILEVSYVEHNEEAPLAEEAIEFMKDYGYSNHIEIGEHYSPEPQWKDIIVQKDLCFYK